MTYRFLPILGLVLVLSQIELCAQHATMIWKKSLDANAVDVSPDGSKLVVAIGRDTTSSVGRWCSIKGYRSIRILNALDGALLDSLNIPGFGVHQPIFDEKSRVVINSTTSLFTFDSIAMYRGRSHTDFASASAAGQFAYVYFGGIHATSFICYSPNRRHWIWSLSESVEESSPPSTSTTGICCVSDDDSDSIRLVATSAIHSAAISDDGSRAISEYFYSRPYRGLTQSTTEFRVWRKDGTPLLNDKLRTHVCGPFSPNSEYLLVDDSLRNLNRGLSVTRLRHTTNLRFVTSRYTLSLDSTGIQLTDIQSDTVVEHFSTPNNSRPLSFCCSANMQFMAVLYADSQTAVWRLDMRDLDTARMKVISAEANNYKPDVLEQVHFRASVYPLDDSVRYDWDFGNGSHSSQSNPTHWYTKSGTYTVKLTIYGRNGYVDSAYLKAPVQVIPISSECLSYMKFSNAPITAVQFDVNGNESVVADSSGMLRRVDSVLRCTDSLRVPYITVSSLGVNLRTETVSFFGKDFNKQVVRQGVWKTDNRSLSLTSADSVIWVSRNSLMQGELQSWRQSETENSSRISADGSLCAYAYSGTINALYYSQFNNQYSEASAIYGGYCFKNNRSLGSLQSPERTLLGRFNDLYYLRTQGGLVRSYSCDLSADLKRVAFLSDTKSFNLARRVHIYDVNTNELVADFLDSSVNVVRFTNGSRSIITQRKLVSLDSNTERRLLRMGACKGFEVVPGSKQYLVCYAQRRDSCLWIYDFQNDTVVHRFGHICDSPNGISISIDPPSILVGGAHGSLTKWPLPKEYVPEKPDPTDSLVPGIAPNPAASICKITIDTSLGSPIHTVIYNSQGSSVMELRSVSTDSDPVLVVDIQALCNGMYYVVERGTRGRTTVPLAVVHD